MHLWYCTWWKIRSYSTWTNNCDWCRLGPSAENRGKEWLPCAVCCRTPSLMLDPSHTALKCLPVTYSLLWLASAYILNFCYFLPSFSAVLCVVLAEVLFGGRVQNVNSASYLFWRLQVSLCLWQDVGRMVVILFTGGSSLCVLDWPPGKV